MVFELRLAKSDVQTLSYKILFRAVWKHRITDCREAASLAAYTIRYSVRFMQKKSRQAAKYYKAGRIDVFEQNWTMPNPKQIQAKCVPSHLKK